ncbi:MAG: ParB/RepB/Spo0J family partition protein [Gottschalkiaceae bacterium]|nr:MAG: ParB/RepB/Spo0J family partition protein [Gottschalkiaceae bacterium]
MEKKKIININELFFDEEDLLESSSSGVKEVSLSELIPFKNHPFKLYEGERLNDMVESIKEHGIITPLIVRFKEEGKYEILSGHNRANAGKIAGLEKVPVVIKEGLTDEEAMLIVTETNLIQRAFSELTHSEKARILTERHNAIKEQGRRTDLINEIEKLSNHDELQANSNFRQFGENYRADVKVASSYDLSPRNVSRYLRIDTLIDELKDRLDNGELPFMAAVDLSYLKEDEQETLEDILQTYGFKVDLKKSEVLKKYSQRRSFNQDKAYEVLSGKHFDKPKKAKSFKIKPKLVSKFFKENQTPKEVEEIIEKALELYFSKSKEVEIENEDKLEME